MEGEKWENLSTEVLVNVFGRVGMESLLLDIPLVCKSWYKASRQPQCWQHLVFPTYIKPDDIIMEKPPVGLVPDSSFMERCPKLMSLDLGPYNASSIRGIMKEVIEHIGAHCPNLVSLSAPGICCFQIDASALVASLPKIKYLDLRGVFFEKGALVSILQGRKQLVHFDVRDCWAFPLDEAQILKLASHIPSFLYQGARREPR